MKNANVNGRSECVGLPARMRDVLDYAARFYVAQVRLSIGPCFSRPVSQCLKTVKKNHCFNINLVTGTNA